MLPMTAEFELKPIAERLDRLIALIERAVPPAPRPVEPTLPPSGHRA